MTDNTAPEATDPLEGQDPAQDATPQEVEAQEEQTFSAEYVRKLRQENAKYRTERNTALATIQEHEDAGLAENQQFKELADKRQERIVELEQGLVERDDQLRDSAIRTTVFAEAAKAGFVDPEEAFRLADLSKVKVDDDGSVSGASESVQALAEAKPHLLKTDGKTKAPDTGATNPAGAEAQTNPVHKLVDERLKGVTDMSLLGQGGGGVNRE